MATNPVHSASLPVVAAGKITACHKNPQQMQAGVSKWPFWRSVVFTALPPVAALGATVAEE